MPTRSTIAAQGYTVRDFAKTPEDVVKTCVKLKKIGYDAVQVSAWASLPPQEMAKILTGEGLTCAATHASWELLLKEPEKVAEEHAILGCRHTAIGGAPGLFNPAVPKRTDADWSILITQLTTVAKKINSLGLTFSYHNHAAEFERIGKRTIIDTIIEDSSPALGMEIDTYWVQYGGADPATYIRKVANRIPLLHLKDMAIKDNKIIMAEVGEGNLSWKSILAAAKEAGVEWYIIEQDICQRDPFDSLAISLTNLKAMGIH